MWEKEKLLVTSIFYFFHTVLENFNFWVTVNLSSANAFNFNVLKILSFGKELSIIVSLCQSLHIFPPPPPPPTHTHDCCKVEHNDGWVQYYSKCVYNVYYDRKKIHFIFWRPSKKLLLSFAVLHKGTCLEVFVPYTMDISNLSHSWRNSLSFYIISNFNSLSFCKDVFLNTCRIIQ